MGFFRGDIYSYALDKMTPIHIYLPYDDNRRFLVNKPQHTVILLHGLEGNYSYWNRYTSVERYAQSKNLALIMPDADMSMYADMHCGQRYGEYIGQELPELLKNMFQLNMDREHLSIAGLSMGGYGAVKAALQHPETFGRCASFSGALMLGSTGHLDILRKWKDPGRKETYTEMEEIERSMYYGAKGAYGENFTYHPENDLLHLADQLIKSGTPPPKFLFTCGSEDFLFQINRQYTETFLQLGIGNSFHTWPGAHNWLFWEESIRDYIDFFCEK